MVDFDIKDNVCVKIRLISTSVIFKLVFFRNNFYEKTFYHLSNYCTQPPVTRLTAGFNL